MARPAQLAGYLATALGALWLAWTAWQVSRPNEVTASAGHDLYSVDVGFQPVILPVVLLVIGTVLLIASRRTNNRTNTNA